MADSAHVALIRGINVGGRNPVPMAELRDAFTDHGFSEVRTYIQSGNVVFSSSLPARSVEDEVTSMLSDHLGMSLVVVVRSARRFHSVLERAPEGFGQHPDEFHSDVIFLRSPLTSAAVMRRIELRDGVDRAWAGTDVVYFQRLSERRTQTRMNRLMQGPDYQLMTIRNWATTTRLAAMLDEG